ncbi:signal recognition particle 54 kDa protein [Trifolium repens]|nr:signal recognition particle 54 kDa protein [Trifolium repens]
MTNATVMDEKTRRKKCLNQITRILVGLQGSAGKTTTCTKYGNYYQKNKGLKAGPPLYTNCAFDELKQNVTKANIPVYGSYMEYSDPVKIAVEGVEKFKEENCDLIILDTIGCTNKKLLFSKNCAKFQTQRNQILLYLLSIAVSVSLIFFRLKHLKFKQSVAVGAVFITKVDGHAIGGGSFSAVAATKSPVIFVGTGEHMDEFEVFQVKPFVSRLLGAMGDSSEFVDTIHEVDVPRDQVPGFFELPELFWVSDTGTLHPRELFPPSLP